MNSFRKFQAHLIKLAQMDPQDAAVDATCQVLKEEAALISEAAKGTESDRVESIMKDDVELLNEQISQLHAAAAVPARNFARIHSICAGLKRAAVISQRPQFSAMRPQIASLTAKVAGIFAEVDTVQDLDKPLEAIEKAVHSLYGDQGKNSTFYFDRRGKGHQKSE